MTTPHDPLTPGGPTYPPGAFSPTETTVPPMPPTGVGNVSDSAFPGDSADSSGSVTDTARDQAQQVKDSAADATSQVAQTGKEQVRQVTDDVRSQAKQLAGETKNQLTEQASSQRDRAVSSLRSLGDELSSMSQSSEQSGVGTQLAREGSDLTHKAANFLEQRDPTQLLDEVRNLARRRPGAFLVGAAVAGVVAGRLTRGAVSARSDDSSGQQAADMYPPAPAYGDTYAGAQVDPLAAGVSVPGRTTASSSPSVAGFDEPAPILEEPYGEQPPPAGYSGQRGGMA